MWNIAVQELGVDNIVAVAEELLELVAVEHRRPVAVAKKWVVLQFEQQGQWLAEFAAAVVAVLG